MLSVSHRRKPGHRGVVLFDQPVSPVHTLVSQGLIDVGISGLEILHVLMQNLNLSALVVNHVEQLGLFVAFEALGKGFIRVHGVGVF